MKDCPHPPHEVRMRMNHSSSARVAQCGVCWELLSIGPANDAPLEVKIEIEAARIAADGIDLDDFGSPGVRMRSMSWHQGCGWDFGTELDPEFSHDLGCEEPEDGPEHLAGYLARRIVEHDKEAA